MGRQRPATSEARPHHQSGEPDDPCQPRHPVLLELGVLLEAEGADGDVQCRDEKQPGGICEVPLPPADARAQGQGGEHHVFDRDHRARRVGVGPCIEHDGQHEYRPDGVPALELVLRTYVPLNMSRSDH